MDGQPWYKKAWVWIVSAFGVLMSLLFIQKQRADKAEGQVEAGKAREKDAALAEREAATAGQSAEAERKLRELEEEKKRLSETEASPDQVKKYWEDK